MYMLVAVLLFSGLMAQSPAPEVAVDKDVTASKKAIKRTPAAGKKQTGSEKLSQLAPSDAGNVAEALAKRSTTVSSVEKIVGDSVTRTQFEQRLNIPGKMVVVKVHNRDLFKEPAARARQADILMEPVDNKLATVDANRVKFYQVDIDQLSDGAPMKPDNAPFMTEHLSLKKAILFNGMKEGKSDFLDDTKMPIYLFYWGESTADQFVYRHVGMFADKAGVPSFEVFGQKIGELMKRVAR